MRTASQNRSLLTIGDFVERVKRSAHTMGVVGVDTAHRKSDALLPNPCDLLGRIIGDVMSEEDDAPTELRDLRRSIDNIDAAIIHMLAERFRYTQRVGALKARHKLHPADPAREAYQVKRLRHLAEAAQLDPEFAEKYLAFVIREVIRHHEAFPRVQNS